MNPSRRRADVGHGGPAGRLGDAAVRYRLEIKPDSVRVVFMPGTVRDLIEAVELEGTGFDLEHQGSMWNEQQFASMFTGTLERDARLTASLSVRRGLEWLPIEVDVRDQPLP